ncbi:hypothetical protein DFJ74DRAFT_640030 [Hyaloraphidium curvatum]|nr:hypothetical protein DFJ74DRAFT_640030 [Hyaloraphidium curvatum]
MAAPGDAAAGPTESLWTRAARPDAEDEDEVRSAFCRVCRHSQPPLFHPCRCAGSMRYVHQGCLESWLAHSNSRACEICGTVFGFENVYAGGRPPSIGPAVVAAAVGRALTSAARTAARRTLAAAVWLAAVPYLTVWLARVVFAFSRTGAIVQERLPPLLGGALGAAWRASHALVSDLLIAVLWGGPGGDLTVLSVLRGRAATAGRAAVELWSSEAMSVFLSDTLHGQLLSTSIVMLVLCFLCIREWIVLATPVDAQGRAIVPEEGGLAIPEPPPAPVPAPAAEPVEQQQPAEQPVEQPAEAHEEPVDPDHPLGAQPPPLPDLLDPEGGIFHPPAAAAPIPPALPPALPPQPAPAPALPPLLPLADDDPDAEAPDLPMLMRVLGLAGPVGTLFQSAAVLLVVENAVMVFLGLVPYWFGLLAARAGRGAWRLALMLDAAAVEPLVETAVRGLRGFLKQGTNGTMEQRANETLEGGNATVGELANATAAGVAHLAASIAANANANATLPIEVPGPLDLPGPARAILAAHPFDPPLPTAHILSHILLGHAVLFGILAAYATLDPALLSNPYMATCRRLLRSLWTNAYRGTKVSFFLAFELAVFPLLCGLLVSFCTLPLFGSTVASRLAFHARHPWTSAFLHWIAGTTYMFHLAAHVGLLKRVFRPGTLWFVRDPNDPRGGGLDELWERGWRAQARKLLASLAMYACLVLGGVGGWVLATRALSALAAAAGMRSEWRVFPLHYHPGAALFGGEQVPLDLLAVNLLVPAGLRAVEPDAWAKWAVELWWRRVGRMMGMEGLLFSREEAGADAAPAPPAPAEPETMLLRVPKRDHVPLLPRVPMMVPWEEGAPLAGRPGETEEDVRANWELVRVPRDWKRRVWGMLGLQWVSWVAFGIVAFDLPLILGRLIFAALDDTFDLAASRTGLSTLVLAIPALSLMQSPAAGNATADADAAEAQHVPLIGPMIRPDLPVHDAYSFFMGWGVILGLYGAVKYLPVGLRHVASLAEDPRLLRTVRRVLPAVGYYSLALFLVCGILPFLVGTVFSVYILLPLRSPRDTTQLTFPLSDWALGVVYLKILYNLALLQPDQPDLGGPWVLRNPRPRETEWVKLALRKVLLPMLAGSVALLVGPWMMAGAVSAFVLPRYPGMFGIGGEGGVDLELARELLHRQAYPIVLCGVIAVEALERVAKAVKGWLEKERDERYLVGRRLHNFEGGSAGTAAAL